MSVDDVLAALGDSTRRRIFELLAKAPSSASALAGEMPVTRQAIAKHLDVLEAAGLVRARRDGRAVVYEVRTEPLDRAAEWMRRVGHEWDGRLDRLKRR